MCVCSCLHWHCSHSDSLHARSYVRHSRYYLVVSSQKERVCAYACSKMCDMGLATFAACTCMVVLLCVTCVLQAQRRRRIV